MYSSKRRMSAVWKASYPISWNAFRNLRAREAGGKCPITRKGINFYLKMALSGRPTQLLGNFTPDRSKSIQGLFTKFTGDRGIAS